MMAADSAGPDGHRKPAAGECAAGPTRPKCKTGGFSSRVSAEQANALIREVASEATVSQEPIDLDAASTPLGQGCGGHCGNDLLTAPANLRLDLPNRPATPSDDPRRASAHKLAGPHARPPGPIATWGNSGGPQLCSNGTREVAVS